MAAFSGFYYIWSKNYLEVKFAPIPFLINISAIFKTSTSSRYCSWIKFKFPSRARVIILLYAVFNLLISEAARFASVDPIGDTLAISKNFRLFDRKIYNNILAVYESLQKVNDIMKQTFSTNIIWLIQEADIGQSAATTIVK